MKKITGFAVKTVARIAALKNLKFSRRLKKVFIVVVVLLALAEAGFAVPVYGFRKDNKIIRAAVRILPYPAAIVNFDFVTYGEYLDEKDYIHHFYDATNQEGVNVAEVDKQILSQLIENKLVNFEAKRYGVKVKNEEIDRAVAAVVEQNGGEEKVQKVLEDYYGLNLGKFRRLVKNQLLRDKINDEVIMKVTVRHILVKVDKDAPADKVEAAKAKIDGFLKEIEGGLDFAEAAKKYSEDIGSNEQGGELEPFSRGVMVKEFSDAAFSTPVGQISAPVKTEFGWHIIKVESKKGRIEKNFGDWLDGVRQKSLILKMV